MKEIKELEARLNKQIMIELLKTYCSHFYIMSAVLFIALIAEIIHDKIKR